MRQTPRRVYTGYPGLHYLYMDEISQIRIGGRFAPVIAIWSYMFSTPFRDTEVARRPSRLALYAILAVFLTGMTYGQQFEIGADIGYGVYRNGTIYSASGSAQAGM